MTNSAYVKPILNMPEMKKKKAQYGTDVKRESNSNNIKKKQNLQLIQFHSFD